MTNSHPSEPQDVLQRAEQILRARGHGAVPPRAAMEEAIAALEARDQHIEPKRRFWTMKRIYVSSLSGALAACFIIAAVLGILNRNTRLAAADVVESLRKVQSAKMKIETRMDMAGMKVNVAGTLYASQGRQRQEFTEEVGIINIFNFRTGKGLIISPMSKSVTRVDLANLPKNSGSEDILENFKKLQDNPTKVLGEKEIDGRKLQGFYWDKAENGSTRKVTMWADGQTKMPVIIEMRIENSLIPQEIRLTEFDWNYPMDEKLFALDIPEGYTVSDAALDFGKPQEKDLVVALKSSTLFNDGKFPEGLKLEQLARAMAASIPDASQVEKKMREQSVSMLQVAHGWSFITNPENGSDWHWAGTGIALGTKGKPVIWYKPKGKETYTVIDADLTIHTETKAPDVDAFPIEIPPAK